MATNMYQFTPLMCAVYAGSFECVKALTIYRTMYDLNDKDIDDHCVFHLCAKKNRLACLKYLMTLVNKQSAFQILELKDKYENTILHMCAKQGHFEMFKYIVESVQFIKHQNLIFHKNYNEQTCFHLSCKEGHEKIVR